MPYKRKTMDQWVIECNYGFGDGWEAECVELRRKDARDRLKEYQENSPYPVRIRKRRVKIDGED